jgi:hypothetical protein
MKWKLLSCGRIIRTKELALRYYYAPLFCTIKRRKLITRELKRRNSTNCCGSGTGVVRDEAKVKGHCTFFD